MGFTIDPSPPRLRRGKQLTRLRAARYAVASDLPVFALRATLTRARLTRPRPYRGQHASRLVHPALPCAARTPYSGPSAVLRQAIWRVRRGGAARENVSSGMLPDETHPRPRRMARLYGSLLGGSTFFSPRQGRGVDHPRIPTTEPRLARGGLEPTPALIRSFACCAHKIRLAMGGKGSIMGAWACTARPRER